MDRQILIDFILDLARIFGGLFLSLTTFYISTRFFDKLTSNLDEWEEIKKGNIAVGIFFSSIILSVFLIVSPSIVSLVLSNSLNSLVFNLFKFLISLVLSIVLPFLALFALDYLTPQINELEELKKGNIAISLYLSFGLLGISLIISSLVPKLFLL
jgi:uncharacterized membrane protein YjfL (UPF0719 family)